jgi:uncharacterized membrane protein
MIAKVQSIALLSVCSTAGLSCSYRQMRDNLMEAIVNADPVALVHQGQLQELLHQMTGLSATAVCVCGLEGWSTKRSSGRQEYSGVCLMSS